MASIVRQLMQRLRVKRHGGSDFLIPPATLISCIRASEARVSDVEVLGWLNFTTC